MNAAPSHSPLYFLHIAKTAGTSFRSLIDAQFKESDIAPFYLTHELVDALEKDKECLEKYALIRGHMGFSPTLLMKRRPHIITMLRDPIARTISHYEHIIRHEDHWLFEGLPNKKLSLEAFLDFEPTRRLVTNFQVRNLAQDFDFLSPPLRPANLGRLLSTLMPEISDPLLLSQAKARLTSFAFAGITEKFDTSLRRLCETFGWQPPEAAPRHNTAPEGRLTAEKISQSTRNEIELLTSLDRALYDFAVQQFSM